MGVSRTDYLMLAVDVGTDSFDWDKHEAEAAGAPSARFDIVYDGMCGGYCFAGKVIARSDPHEGFGQEVIVPSQLDIDRYDLAAKVSEAFGAKHAAEDFRLVLFSHFS